MIVQIYEINNVAEALKMAEMGVDHIGVVVGDGSYDVEIKSYKAREIFLALPQDKNGVALFLTSDIDSIIRMVKEAEPDILQLAAPPENILPSQIEDIRTAIPNLPIMRTIPVGGEESVAAAMVYDGVCDFLLLDSKDPKSGQIGVTGRTHEWGISRKIVETVRTKVILAGGLGPENVIEAIKTVRPYGVDSKTKTDRIGGKGKDLIKVKRFVDLAKSVDKLEAKT
ncbi:MAG: N-(5'-phosphoribosyl)anthranilate isomerase [Microgenomates group bacterium GW2011_GWC1_37_8]|uniref:N-(5'-phosphoribosyl)anthranilate isomerase n=2 Tax=Candidatus Woeseibacteriota TaxID=1752722 RepID=A0A0G0PAA9_9BACT|nr:MAG: N-(5'-phosphoribosyl)anthranilate isomerase [Microgenomates group bacterium GW2011_GWC1_37_8]KKQ86231.1 MAG: N-(5'-phosphoribosyl)anthranilate isomerase [Candidatus Woesebacteria bacterium GW2011_GWB1_38_8]OGM20368.1 MAG: hypothetical protein A2863_04515 [Candidatus Woesebacteria bacterium RIFCSPHIGHO2_01_FULL_38_9b]